MTSDYQVGDTKRLLKKEGIETPVVGSPFGGLPTSYSSEFKSFPNPRYGG